MIEFGNSYSEIFILLWNYDFSYRQIKFSAFFSPRDNFKSFCLMEIR